MWVYDAESNGTAATSDCVGARAAASSDGGASASYARTIRESVVHVGRLYSDTRCNFLANHLTVLELVLVLYKCMHALLNASTHARRSS
jgi:hypothetical protein